jgi:hypothetical protein
VMVRNKETRLRIDGARRLRGLVTSRTRLIDVDCSIRSSGCHENVRGKHGKVRPGVELPRKRCTKISLLFRFK